MSALGLFLIGASITLFTGKNVWYSGFRQVLFGLLAAAITFGIGRAPAGQAIHYNSILHASATIFIAILHAKKKIANDIKCGTKILSLISMFRLSF